MEFNVFEHFKGFQRTGEAPRTPEEQGTRFFLGGHLGPRLDPHIDDAAAKARMSRRNFLATASALPAAMLAVNNVTGMRSSTSHRPKRTTRPRPRRSRSRASRGRTSSSTPTRTSASARTATSPV